MIYRFKGYEIREPTRNDGENILKGLIESEIGKQKPNTCLGSINKINRLKGTVKTLVELETIISYIILYDGEYIGHIILSKDEFDGNPIVNRMFIVNKFKKSIALTCVGDFLLNFKYKGKQLISLSDSMPGFKKRITPVFKNKKEPVMVKDIDKLRRVFRKACKGAIYEQ